MSVHILCPPENKHMHHYYKIINIKCYLPLPPNNPLATPHITRSHYKISLCTFPIGGLAIPLLSIIIIIYLMVTLNELDNIGDMDGV